MSSQDRFDLRRVCWNGVSLDVPEYWVVKATGRHHLNIECNFEAVLEMRWQVAPPKSVAGLLKSSVEQYMELTGVPLTQTRMPAHLSESHSPFEIHCYGVQHNETVDIIFLYAKQSSTFLMLQLHRYRDEAFLWDTIHSIRCIPADASTQTWAIQDFRIDIPASFLLSHYKMEAGFSLLQLQDGRETLNVCRLAPARIRLQQHSLHQLFFSLLGQAKEDEQDAQLSSNCITLTRMPNLFRQIVYRLQRKSPFLCAALWHNIEADRLLGVFMEGIRPIDVGKHQSICKSYEIISA